jgi:uncharacterized protein
MMIISGGFSLVRQSIFRVRYSQRNVEVLSDRAKKILLELAREAVLDFLEGKPDKGDMAVGLYPEELQERRGIFVAIYNRDRLRGCIGSLLGVLPLWQSCRENARSAAVKDVRFQPISREELPDLRYEIMILGTARELKDSLQISPGTDGLILKKGFRREVFLPGAFADLIREKRNQLDELKAKAGFEPDDNTPETWEIFEAEVITPQSSIRNPESI